MIVPPERLAAALADRYRVERELGAGGMATVYLAQDLKHDRKVAIKVIRPELAAVIGRSPHRSLHHKAELNTIERSFAFDGPAVWVDRPAGLPMEHVIRVVEPGPMVLISGLMERKK
ncbi:MAG: hypothetical protein ABI679_15740 [Gemmatimonadota bacterium]